MAASRLFASAMVFLAVMFVGLHGVLGEIQCENLPIEACAFSVSAFGNRCVLEKFVMEDNSLEYECQSSNVIASESKELVESDECLKACGMQRMWVGMSSDHLLEPHVTTKLCSAKCYNNCPNIIDLHFDIAAGEGMYLPSLCEAHRRNLEQFGAVAAPPTYP